jgi:hypothetical protein
MAQTQSKCKRSLVTAQRENKFHASGTYSNPRAILWIYILHIINGRPGRKWQRIKKSVFFRMFIKCNNLPKFKISDSSYSKLRKKMLLSLSKVGQKTG